MDDATAPAGSEKNCPNGLRGSDVAGRINEVAGRSDAADLFARALATSSDDLVEMVRTLLGEDEADPQVVAYADRRPMMTRILLGVAATVAAREAALQLAVALDSGAPELSVDRADGVVVVTVKSLDA